MNNHNDEGSCLFLLLSRPEGPKLFCHVFSASFAQSTATKHGCCLRCIYFVAYAQVTADLVCILQ